MLRLDAPARQLLWERLGAAIEHYTASVGSYRVAPELDPGKIREFLEPLDFVRAYDPMEALALAVEGLTRYQVHTPHPRYFGLFNPAPATMGITADALVAAFNPQLAAWSHSPFAAEVERRLIQVFGERFGYETGTADGTFASGGMEANHSAVLAALTQSFPEFRSRGLRALEQQPVLYVSSESHHSFLKAARLCGLGSDALRHIPVDQDLRMDVEALASVVAEDRRRGLAPFLVVGTAGTTNAGVIDPLNAIADAAAGNRLWFHADAAWGGAAVLVPELRPLLVGIERADSITFDAHKWLSVPMGAGLFLTRHPSILAETFRVDTAYMPREAEGLSIADPYRHSMQWSRRFIGLKVFLSMLVAGWDGYAAAIRHQTEMGRSLRRCLIDAGWEIANRTELPVVCFADPKGSAEDHQKIAMAVVASGEAWISTTLLGGSRAVLRACITHYGTEESDIHALIATLERARSVTIVEEQEHGSSDKK